MLDSMFAQVRLGDEYTRVMSPHELLSNVRQQLVGSSTFEHSLDKYCSRHGEDLLQLQLEVIRALQQWMSQNAAPASAER